MRTRRRLIALSLIALIALLAACGDDDAADTPDADNAPPQEAPQEPTETPWPTAWPTLPTATPAATQTPYPTPDLTQATDEPLDNYVLPAEWRTEPFTLADGTQQTFEDYAGRTLIVHTLAARCESCAEQQRRLAQAIEDRIALGALPDVIYLTLGIEPAETPAMIETMVRDELGDAWQTFERVQGEETPGDWIAAVASPALNEELQRAFGDLALDPQGMTVIVIEPDGLAHLTTEGLVDWHELRNVIAAYGVAEDADR